jgi:hypothetical protein
LVLTEVWTLAALVPPVRPRPLATLGFRLGLTMNELPFVAFAWLTASTVLALVQGDLTSPITIGAAVVTFASVGLVAWRGSRTLPAVCRAMGPVPVSRRLPYGRILFRPFFRRRGAVERIPDLPYGPAGTRNLLDVYRHRSRPTGAPVLIHLHGGTYKRGGKNSQSLPLLYRLAGQGWIGISATQPPQPSGRLGGQGRTATGRPAAARQPRRQDDQGREGPHRHLHPRQRGLLLHDEEPPRHR